MPNLGAVANTWQVRRPTNRAGQTAPRTHLTGGLQPAAGSSGPLNLTATGGNATADGGWVTALWIDSGVRQLGNLVVTEVWHPRLIAITHTRALGLPTAHGSTDLSPTGLRHTRAQGNPTLSGRALPQGLQHNRTLGTPSVDITTVALLALDRA